MGNFHSSIFQRLFLHHGTLKHRRYYLVAFIYMSINAWRDFFIGCFSTVYYFLVWEKQEYSLHGSQLFCLSWKPLFFQTPFFMNITVFRTFSFFAVHAFFLAFFMGWGKEGSLTLSKMKMLVVCRTKEINSVTKIFLFFGRFHFGTT